MQEMCPIGGAPAAPRNKNLLSEVHFFRYTMHMVRKSQQYKNRVFSAIYIAYSKETLIK
jgi:hypothetical protein